MGEDQIKMKHIKNGTRNRCLECGKEFESMEELFEHEYCYICEQCDNGYESREELEDHRKMKHIENFDSSYDELEEHMDFHVTKIECEEELEEHRGISMLVWFIPI